MKEVFLIIVALFIYDILKFIVNFINHIAAGLGKKAGEREVKKSFKDRLNEKMND